MGWGSGTFGLFGLHKQDVPSPILNYVGVGICMLSIVAYVFVKTENTPNSDSEKQTLLDTASVNYNPTDSEEEWIEKIPVPYRRILGIVLSVISGIFYGVRFFFP
jgi:hypothetical protein